MFAACVLQASLSGAASAQTLVLLSGDVPHYKDFVAALRGHLESSGSKEEIVVHQEREVAAATALEGYRFVITVGVSAAQKVKALDTGNAKLIYTLMPSASSHWLNIDSELKSSPEKSYVIYLDQPPNRYIALSQELLSRQNITLGLLHSIETKDQALRLLSHAGGKVKIELHEVSTAGDIVSVMQAKMRDVDVMLALPDAKLFNNQSLQAVLLTSFRMKLPLVTFSEGFVQAGATAALVTNSEDAGRQTAELMACLASNCAETAPNEYWPKYFSVSINKTVARRLGIAVPDQAELVDQIKSMERTGAP